ncbi:Serine/threonine-protein kinase OSR1, partial [Morella rubra]
VAPEVMQQLHGYDFKADIWSFGITVLELAHGHAPFSKYAPMKVEPCLFIIAGFADDFTKCTSRFGLRMRQEIFKVFQRAGGYLLGEGSKKAPTSEKLLKHPFFKQARTIDYVARSILDGFAFLGDRFRTLKKKEADLLVQNKALYGDKEHLSQVTIL